MVGTLAREQQELESSADPGALVTGDCSLRKILVLPPPENNSTRIYLIEPETVRAGHPEFDVGALAAMVTSFALIHHPNTDHRFVPAFSPILSPSSLLRLSKRLGITTGIDLLSLGTFMPWSRKKGDVYLEGVVTAGFELLRCSLMGDESRRIALCSIHLHPSSHNGRFIVVYPVRVNRSIELWP
ncbi:hypothetical protein RSAG8_04666, partial [Rhizoctonia solani AG-8 WAC10335]